MKSSETSLDAETQYYFTGIGGQRAQSLSEDHDFYIINHDGLGVGSRRNSQRLILGDLACAIRDRQDIDCVIVDEASAYKDGTTQRYKILRQVVANKPYLYILSGTPTPNGPTDAYSLAKLCGALSTESFGSFRNRTMEPQGPFRWVPRPESAVTVRTVLQPAVRFSREECLDLPECVVETRDVAFSPTQQKAYDTLRKELAVTIAGGRQITAINEAVLRIKLIQIACGAVYGPDREIYRTDAAPRLNVLTEVINEAGGKIIVFAPLTSVVTLIYGTLCDTFGVESTAKVYGGTTQNARSEIFRAFEQDKFPRIIVADPGTMSHGLTLVAANTIVWYGPTDKGEVYQQANARINRPGQTRNTLIVRLASTPVERAIYKRLHEKQSLQGTILKLVEGDR